MYAGFALQRQRQGRHRQQSIEQRSIRQTSCEKDLPDPILTPHPFVETTNLRSLGCEKDPPDPVPAWQPGFLARNWCVLVFLPHATATLQVLRSMAAVLEVASFTPYLQTQCGVNFFILVSRRVLAQRPKVPGSDVKTHLKSKCMGQSQIENAVVSTFFITEFTIQK